MVEIEGGGDRPHEERLGHPGRTLEEDMAAAEQRREGQFDDFFLAVDDLGELRTDRVH